MASINYPSLPLCPECGKLHITCTYCGLRLTIDFQQAPKLTIYCPKCSAQANLTNMGAVKQPTPQPTPQPVQKREQPPTEQKTQKTIESIREKLELTYQRDLTSYTYHNFSYYAQQDLGLEKGDSEISRLSRLTKKVYKEYFGKLPRKNHNKYYYTER